jgi:hypothetical protein
MSHAPVGWLLRGLMHGAHRSVGPQLACGRSVSYFWTCGTQTLRHTPSALLSDLQLKGVNAGFWMKTSGTHNWGAPPPMHVAS